MHASWLVLWLALVLLFVGFLGVVGKRSVDSLRLKSFLSKNKVDNLYSVLDDNGINSVRELQSVTERQYERMNISIGDQIRVTNALKNQILDEECLEKVAKASEKLVEKSISEAIVKTYDLEQQREAYRIAVAEHKREGTSARHLAKKYAHLGVTRTPLQQRISGKVQVDAEMGRPSLLGAEVEKLLLEWVDGMVDRGYPVSRGDIDDKAKQLQPNLKCSNSWFDTLKKNNPDSLSLRRTEQLDRLRAGALNPEVVQHYSDMVEALIEKLGLTPDNIWNMDETGCSMNQNKLYTYCRRGRRQVYASTAANREHVSIVSAVSASGEYLPEFFIFKGKNDFDALKDANPDADFKMSEKGYMTDEVWPFWCKHFIDCLPPKEERGYVLLVMDGYGSHCSRSAMLEIFLEHKIICLGLPAHTSSSLQPLDVGIFGPFKKALRKAFSDWLKEHPGESFKKENFAALVKDVWRKAHSKENIVSAFAKSGLCPHDSELVQKVCKGVADPLYVPPLPEILVSSAASTDTIFFDSIDQLLETSPVEMRTRFDLLTSSLVSPPKNRKRQRPEDLGDVATILSYPKRKQPKGMRRKRKTAQLPSTKAPDLPNELYCSDNEEAPDSIENEDLTMASFSRILNGPQRIARQREGEAQKKEQEKQKKQEKDRVASLESPILEVMRVFQIAKKGKSNLVIDDLKAVVREFKMSGVTSNAKKGELLEFVSEKCAEMVEDMKKTQK